MAKRLIDLTGPFHEGMAAYGTPSLRHLNAFKPHVPLKIKLSCTYEEAGFTLPVLEFDGEQGTCMIAPATGVKGGRLIEDIPLSDTVGEAVVVEVSKKAGESVRPEEMEEGLAKSGFRERDVVLLHTGWGDAPSIYAKWYTKEYVTRSPYLEVATSQLIVEKKIKAFGSDMSTFTKVPSEEFRQYEILAEGDTIMMPCLVALNELKKKRVFFVGLPLKSDITACPMRAIAIEED